MIANFKTRLLFLLTVTGLLLPGLARAAAAPLVQVLEPVSAGVSTPLRIASDRAGTLYLTDPRAGGVLKFTSSGLPVATFLVAPPQGIAVTPSGDLIIGQDDSVIVLDPAGQEKFRLGKGAYQFKKANGIAVDAAGYIYVVDSLDDCVQIFTSQGIAVNSGRAATGKPANSFGTGGSANGQLSMPTGIAYEKVSGQLAVADTGNGRIQFFDITGAWKKSIGSPGVGALRFTAPVGVAFEYGGGSTPSLVRMYVADSFQSSIQVVDPAANPVPLGYIGGYGRAKGKLLNPADVHFDQLGGRLLVANGFGTIAAYGINGGGTPTADTTPPTLTVNPAPAVTASPTLVLSGSLENGATLTVTTDTAAVAGTPQISATGTWTVTVAALAAGVNGITVTATDTAGNITTRSLAVTYSATAVNLTIDPVATPVNTPTLTVSGTMGAGAAVFVALSTPATAGPVTYPTATTWRSTITGLVSGENIITVTAARTGSVSAVSRAVVVLSTTPPPLSLAMPADGSTTSLQLLTITGLTAPDIATVTVNGAVIPVSNGLFSTGILLSGGVNTILVTATDVAGNTTRETRQITYDPAAPAVRITTPTAGRVTNQSTFQVSGTSASGSSTAIKVNGAVQANLSGTAWTATVNLAQGSGLYTIEALASDAGSGKTATAAVTIELVDLTTPVVELATPPADVITNSSTFSISGSVTAATVTATVNGAAVAVTQNAVGGYSLAVPFTSEGKYTLLVTATDPLGNSSSVFRTLIYDVTPPTLAVTAQSAAAISGSGEADSVVTVRNASGAVIGTAVVQKNGSWSIPLTGSEPLPLSVDARDAAGNGTRNGDVNGSGSVDLADALRAMRIAIKAEPAPAANSPLLLHGDVAPLVNGVSLPDGKIDIDDVMVILMKAVGLIK